MIKYQLINNLDEFNLLFNFGEHPEYEKYTVLQDVKIGFSIQRKYPNDIRYKPPETKEHNPDVVALIHVVYGKGKLNNNHDELTQIEISISPHSRYLSDHFDFNFEDDDCPTQKSIYLSKKTPKPIDLTFYQEIYFDHRTNLFIDTISNISYNGIELLDYIFIKHCNTIHWFKGAKLHLRLSFHRIRRLIYDLFISFIILILKYSFGRSLEPSDPFSYLKGYSWIDLKKLSIDSIDFYGYKTAKNVIVTFCVLTLLFYSLFFYFNWYPLYIVTILKNPFLTLITGILFIVILDNCPPRLLFHLLNFLIGKKRKQMFKSIEY